MANNVAFGREVVQESSCAVGGGGRIVGGLAFWVCAGFGLSGVVCSMWAKGLNVVKRGRLVWGRVLVAFSCTAVLAGFVSVAVVSAAPAPRTLRLLSDGTANPDPNFAVFFGGVSADGARVFFDAAERLVLGDTDDAFDVYSRDLDGSLVLLSDGMATDDPPADAFFRGVSPNGTRVFFNAAERLVLEDTDTARDVYSRDAGGSLVLLSDGRAADDPPADARFGAVSPDGARVFFETAERLLSNDDTDDAADVYSREADGSLRLLSDGMATDDPPAGAFFGGLSADGARVFFSARENLVPEDTDDGTADVYSRELGGSPVLLSDGRAADDARAEAFFKGVSADGARVFFVAAERLLPDEDTDTTFDVYSREADGSLRVLSDGAANPDLDIQASFGGVSADGARVFFTTQERLLPDDDTDTTADVYSRDLDGSLRLLSDGPSSADPNAGAGFGGVSADGARVFFTTQERLLPDDDTDTTADVYSRDLDGSLRLLSDGTANPDLDADAGFDGVSADGARVFFTTNEQLVGADTDTANDLYESAFAVPSFAGGASVKGRARVGSRVACVPGGFVGESLTSTIAWLRDGNPIAGAGSDGYRIVRADGGHRLACRVTLRNAIGSASQTSAAVLVDVRAPVVRVSSPRCARKVRKAACRRLQHSARAWATLRGTVRDPEPASGIARVQVSVVRGSGRRCQVYTGLASRELVARLPQSAPSEPRSRRAAGRCVCAASRPAATRCVCAPPTKPRTRANQRPASCDCDRRRSRRLEQQSSGRRR